MSTEAFAEYRGHAQAMVTLLRAGERSEAFEEIADCDPLLLALTLADLVAYVHRRWADAIGIDADQAWRELLLDIAEWEVAS